ncbi:MAG: hypothetical protein JSV68_20775 [Anaerolineaceae bacterium]|nr:MAG: hypothetical protein JSV68_20775 [Anaerolineaceae bacterium]
MLALIVARPGPVCDGLVALLSASQVVTKIVQIAQPEDAWDFVQSICPNLTLIYASPLQPDLAHLITQMKAFCHRPVLVIVNSEEDRQAAATHGADSVVMEGIPSSKLATHITILLQKSSQKEKVS